MVASALKLLIFMIFSHASYSRVVQAGDPSVCVNGQVRELLTLAETAVGNLRRDFAQLEDIFKNISHHGNPQDVCSGTINYRMINDFDGFRDLHNSTLGFLCDNTTFTTWYRWLLYGQDAIIATSCTPMRKCGGLATMWVDLNGQQLPAVGREVQGHVCTHWDNSCCWFERRPVTVHNCGSYYIYKLNPTISCNAYCLQRKI